MYNVKGKFDKKKIINNVIYTAIGLMVILFLLSIYVGNKANNEKQNKEKSQESQKNEEVHIYDGKNQTQQGEKEKEKNDTDKDEPPPELEDEIGEGEIWEEHEDLERIEPEKVDESLLPKPYEEIYSDKELKESKKTAKEFIKIFYNVDGDDPMKYIKKSKKYMTDDLYKRLEQHHENGGMTWTYGIQRDYNDSEIYEPSSARVKDGIVWAIKVNGTQKIHDKDKDTKTDIYLIHLKKINGKYKVKDYFENVPT